MLGSGCSVTCARQHNVNTAVNFGCAAVLGGCFSSAGPSRSTTYAVLRRQRTMPRRFPKAPKGKRLGRVRAACALAAFRFARSLLDGRRQKNLGRKKGRRKQISTLAMREQAENDAKQGLRGNTGRYNTKLPFAAPSPCRVKEKSVISLFRERRTVSSVFFFPSVLL